MKKTVLLGALLWANFYFSQEEGRVGINTTTPKTTLDVNGKDDVTDITGLQAPRLTYAALIAKGETLYGPDQKGALLYITNISSGSGSRQTVNVTDAGYYYFDGTEWVRIGSGKGVEITASNGLAKTDNNIKLGGPLEESTTISELSAIKKMQFIGDGVDAFNIDGTTFSVDAQNNRIGIGTNAPSQKLDVEGNVRFGGVPTGAYDAATDEVLVLNKTTGVAKKVPSVSAVSEPALMNVRLIPVGSQSDINILPEDDIVILQQGHTLPPTFHFPAAGTVPIGKRYYFMNRTNNFVIYAHTPIQHDQAGQIPPRMAYHYMYVGDGEYINLTGY